MNKSFKSLSYAFGVGAAVLVAQSAQSQQVLYNNATSPSTFTGVNFNPAGTGVTFGNEIVLSTGAPFDKITQVEFQFDLTGTGTFTGNESVDVTLFANNGALVSGAASPGTVYWTSGVSTLQSQGLSGFTSGSTLTYTVPSALVGPDLTFAVTFSGLASGETAGLGLFNPVTVGYNYDDAWVNTGSGWALDKAASGSADYIFGLEVSGTPSGVPEPSTIALGLMGACGFLARFRKK
jgi:PEP-CTERM motif